ncbi:helix-loop-helix DNA-binding domain-containing protein [Mycena floridula]|nr:helix-loop-helix DNA-binding domain-containing protein [Mycena floridula]
MSFFQTIRQEGFHPENPEMPSTAYMNHGKSQNSMDFTDELASLIDTSHERSTTADDGYRPPTHNIFDTSSLSLDYHNHFNSTLPALNSSMRYDPHPDSYGAFTRHTPSPHQNQHDSRSRSRSRPPSSAGGGVGPQRTTRTRRNNSVSSTSPPPHPFGGMNMMGRPQAIVIPGRANGNSSNSGTPVSPLTGTAGGWYIPSQAGANGEYTLPTPDSLHSHSSLHLPSLPQHHHHHHNGAHYNDNAGYAGFGLSPTETTHLPPVSVLHPGSLPKQGGGVLDNMGLGTPTSNSGHPSSLPTTLSHNNERNTSASAPAPSASEKQLLLASEKRRRRRESHNAVERRRRDNINEKISELATLIPECLLEGAGNPNAPTSTQNNNDTSLSLSLDSPTLTSPTSPLALMMGDNNDRVDVDLWGDLASPASLNGNVPKKEPSLDGLYPIGEDAAAPANAAPSGAVVKANKGMILRKSVEYIRYLQQVVSLQGARNRELEDELRGYRAQTNGAETPTANGDMFGRMGLSWGFNGAEMSHRKSNGKNGILGSMPEEDEDGKKMLEGDMDVEGDKRESPITSTSPGSNSTDFDDAPVVVSKKKKVKDDDKDADVALSRGRKRSVKTRSPVSSKLNGTQEPVSTSPTNRYLRTRNGRGKTANDDHDMSDEAGDDERMDI